MWPLLRGTMVCAALIASSHFPSVGQTGRVTVDVSGQCNPFLAGQPPGTTSKMDLAPDQSPLEVVLAVSPCEVVRFHGVAGAVTHDPQNPFSGPEGGVLQFSASDLGISGYTMPLCCLLGVFLPDHVNPGAAPKDLDFSSTASRDFAVLAPDLYQTFFIGDGLRDDGLTVQSFVAPAGATRLFLGVCDGLEWNNNLGSFQSDVEEIACTCGTSVYCTAKVNSQGCAPSIGSTGSPSLSGPDDFRITARDVLNYRVGLLIWGYSEAAQPFMGGTLCIGQSIRRTPLQDSGGNLGVEDCSGSYSYWMTHAYMTSHGIAPGTTVYAQYWTRDPYSLPYPVGLTDALAFSPCP